MALVPNWNDVDIPILSDVYRDITEEVIRKAILTHLKK